MTDTEAPKPKVVVLCGSSRFVQEMAVCQWLMERDEGVIGMGLHLLPVWYLDCPDDHLAEHEGVAEAMDELHLRKIDLADEIFVVNRHSYIGASTRREMVYAAEAGKPIRLYTNDPIGERVETMIADFLAKHRHATDQRKGEDSDDGLCEAVSIADSNWYAGHKAAMDDVIARLKNPDEALIEVVLAVKDVRQRIQARSVCRALARTLEGRRTANPMAKDNSDEAMPPSSEVDV